ncbi:MAG: NAD-dependent epimerase/dehydratase family protein [Hahellaceae bacterium]|nr:NAD-dependent epimerase/dehydratase family protein [Hahellaceae bacterium]
MLVVRYVSTADQNDIRVVIGSRHPTPATKIETVSVNVLEESSLATLLVGFDAVVNCVTGDGQTISQGAFTLVNAALSLPRKPHLIHMSTMAVYGTEEGRVDEQSRLLSDIGWYGEAKVEAESCFRRYGDEGGPATVFRIGCVFGPGSDLWSRRIAQLLTSRRLGDLGADGDGWSNLVHVDDIAQATLLALRKPSVSAGQIYNLAAPDSPRWNRYFRDLALKIGATPLKYVTPRYLWVETHVFAPPLKVIERVLKKVRKATGRLPDGIPPSLARLWAQQIRLDSTKVERELGLKWTQYDVGLLSSAESFIQSKGVNQP